MLPEGLAELYLKRYMVAFTSDEEMEEYDQYSRPMLALLCCASSAIPEEILYAVTKRSTTTERLKATRHMTLLRHMCSAPDEEGRLQFSHKSFSDWLLRDDLENDFGVTAKEGHVALCQILDNMEDDLSESSRTYLRKHGIAHLVGAGRVEDAKKKVLGFESWLLERATKTNGREHVCRRWRGILMCVQCVVFSRWDEGCVGVSGQDGEAVGCDEWGVSADAGGAFFMM